MGIATFWCLLGKAYESDCWFRSAFWLAASPALVGRIQVQEADEAATCELRGAGMLTPALENMQWFS